MSKKVKDTINLLMVVVLLAMGVAVTVLSIINTDVATNYIIRLLGIGTALLALLALNNLPKGK